MKPEKLSQTQDRSSRFSEAALKRIARAFRRAGKITIEVGLVLWFSGRLLLRGLRFSVMSGDLVVSGVPLSIILAFLRDRTARRAYFRQDGTALHDRLCGLGIEERIKDFYRPQIADELELDRYIHQILYERTGYIGGGYRVNVKGMLMLKKNIKDGD